jgi:Flp pilus assembly protein TadG
VGARGRFASSDRGSSAIELVLYTPILMLITFLVVQFALTWYGQEIAVATAREAARVARVEGGGDLALQHAEARGEEYAATIGNKSLDDVVVRVVRVDDDTVRATVTGHSMEIIPGWAPHVSAHVEGPVEMFRPDA